MGGVLRELRKFLTPCCHVQVRPIRAAQPQVMTWGVIGGRRGHDRSDAWGQNRRATLGTGWHGTCWSPWTQGTYTPWTVDATTCGKPSNACSN
ncbi:hypothetical protein LUTEI9C_50018 [Luteimonas sp. 9C]|nr:hypothetical protein LUTEI9C_50018 [Luteimonas sp. 9C]